MLFRFLDDNILLKYKRRSLLLIIITVLFFSVLVFRLYFLQVLSYEKYKKLSEDNRIRILRVKAQRGFIKDREGRILVRNAPSYNLSIIREDTKNLDNLLEKIKKIIDIDVEAVKEKVTKSYYYNPVIVYRGLDFSEVSYLYEHLQDYPGIRIDMDTVRNYTDGFAYSHIVGYMGEINDRELNRYENYMAGDLIGKTGIEREYESQLKGKNGAKQVEVNSLGQVVKTIKTKPPTPGKNVVLSIDLKLQKFVMDLLENKKGTMVVLDIMNNNVITMFSSPSYDLNRFVPYIGNDYWEFLNKSLSKPMMNRAIEGLYPPGSVFKLLMATAALEEDKVEVDDTFRCDGVFRYGAYKYRCWKQYGHGEVDLKRSIVESCDIYYYNVGLKLGIDVISDYAKNFYLGRKTGIDLPNEKSGLFPDRSWKKRAYSQPWYPGETVITSIGQGYTNVTPLQVAVMLSGIFNGGNIYKPSVVKGIGSGDDFEPKPVELINRVPIKDSTKKILLEAVFGAVYGDRGTAYRARVNDINIGGKTGTAQVVSLKKYEKYEDEDLPERFQDHAWFGGVFPVENPRYVVVSMIEHGGSGSQSAASSAGALINKMVKMGYVSD